MRTRPEHDQIDAVPKLEDLKVLLATWCTPSVVICGSHAVRVNEQYRIVFRFEGTDYTARSTAHDLNEDGNIALAMLSRRATIAE